MSLGPQVFVSNGWKLWWHHAPHAGRKPTSGRHRSKATNEKREPMGIWPASSAYSQHVQWSSNVFSNGFSMILWSYILIYLNIIQYFNIFPATRGNGNCGSDFWNFFFQWKYIKLPSRSQKLLKPFLSWKSFHTTRGFITESSTVKFCLMSPFQSCIGMPFLLHGFVVYLWAKHAAWHPCSLKSYCLGALLDLLACPGMTKMRNQVEHIGTSEHQGKIESEVRLERWQKELRMFRAGWSLKHQNASNSNTMISHR